MNKMYIKFSSVTHAMRAKEIIELNGCKVIIRKNNKPLKNDGCGYVTVVTGNTNNVVNLLNINNIKYTGYGYQ